MLFTIFRHATAHRVKRCAPPDIPGSEITSSVTRPRFWGQVFLCSDLTTLTTCIAHRRWRQKIRATGKNAILDPNSIPRAQVAGQVNTNNAIFVFLSTQLIYSSSWYICRSALSTYQSSDALVELIFRQGTPAMLILTNKYLGNNGATAFPCGRERILNKTADRQ